MESNADRLHALRQTSPWGPGVVRLHVNVSYFSTTVRRVTSPTWGPLPPCKQALRFQVGLYFYTYSYTVERYLATTSR